MNKEGCIFELCFMFFLFFSRFIYIYPRLQDYGTLALRLIFSLERWLRKLKKPISLRKYHELELLACRMSSFKEISTKSYSSLPLFIFSRHSMYILCISKYLYLIALPTCCSGRSRITRLLILIGFPS